MEALRSDEAISRSELYAKVFREFLHRRREEEITRKMNEIYADEDSSLEPELIRAQTAILEPEDWD